MRQETVVAQFKALSWYLPGGTGLTTQNLRIECDLADIRTGNVPENKSESLLLDSVSLIIIIIIIIIMTPWL
jgi:hypothetical protein